MTVSSAVDINNLSNAWYATSGPDTGQLVGIVYVDKDQNVKIIGPFRSTIPSTTIFNKVGSQWTAPATMFKSQGTITATQTSPTSWDLTIPNETNTNIKLNIILLNSETLVVTNQENKQPQVLSGFPSYLIKR